MMVFENEIARIVDNLPPLVDANNNSFPIKFMYGNADHLAEYLTLAKRGSFPLIWLVVSEDIHNTEDEIKVTRNNARLIFLSETQAKAELNPYQWQNDFDKVLQPILDNFIKAMQVVRRADMNFKTLQVERTPRYSMNEIDKDLIYICNAITLTADITFYNRYCFNPVIFK